MPVLDFDNQPPGVAQDAAMAAGLGGGLEGNPNDDMEGARGGGWFLLASLSLSHVYFRFSHLIQSR